MQILVAEDDPTSRNILSALLQQHGHDVVETHDGLEAWDTMQQPAPPRIVVLDWMMPGLDGLDVCRRIRNLNDDSYRYIIMETAKGQKQDIQKGFDAGADDYLVKPLDTTQLEHRLRVAERVIEYEEQLQETKQELDEYATEMEQLAEQRAEQLVRADRMATLGTLSAGIAHEINNPASFIAGNAQSLERAWDIIEPQLKACSPDDDDRRQFEFVMDEFPEMIRGIRKGVSRITQIVNGLKSYVHQGKQESADKKAITLSATVEHALELCHNELKYNVEVHNNIPETCPAVHANKQQLEQVFVNLFTNAAHAMEDQDQGELSIEASVEGDEVDVRVTDDGPGMDQETLDRAFDPFYTTKSESKGTGLGLSISHGIIEDHGGELRCRNHPEGGAEFAFNLPTTTDKNTTTATEDQS